MKKRSNRAIFLVFLIVGILCFAAVTRLYKLDQYPPQLNRDEAALAINALYIKQAGVDEWGQRLPLQFKSLGDYKLPGYIYLLSGLLHFRIDDVVVRLPSAISGIVLIISSSLWVKSLFRKQLSTKSLLFFLCAISTAPFAIFYSRMAWEANLALALMITSLTLLHSPQFTWKKDLIAVLLYLGAVITYNSPFLLLPFFVISLPILRGVRSYRKWLMPAVLLSIVFIGIAVLFSNNNAQKTGILFFTDPDVLAQYPTYRMSLPNILRPVMGSLPAYFAVTAFAHYRDTFLPTFLVTQGGQHPWHSILGQGHLYWTIYGLFIVGVLSQCKKVFTFFVSLKKRKSVQESVMNLLPLFFLFISPLPAIFTTDAPHATRSLFTLVMIVVFSAVGLQELFNRIRTHQKQLAPVFFGLMCILLIIETGRYLNQYFITWPKNFSPDFQLGFLPVLRQSVSQHPEGDIAIIDLGWYMYVIVAWYQKIPSSVALQTIQRSGPDLVGLYRVNQVGRFYFVYHDDEPIPNKQGLITRDQYDGHWKL